MHMSINLFHIAPSRILMRCARLVNSEVGQEVCLFLVHRVVYQQKQTLIE